MIGHAFPRLIMDEDAPETSGEALEHLLAILRFCELALDENGRDTDARVLEAHRAQLARGKEWPGDPIDPNTPERLALWETD